MITGVTKFERRGQMVALIVMTIAGVMTIDELPEEMRRQDNIVYHQNLKEFEFESQKGEFKKVNIDHIIRIEYRAGDLRRAYVHYCDRSIEQEIIVNVGSFYFLKNKTSDKVNNLRVVRDKSLTDEQRIVIDTILTDEQQIVIDTSLKESWLPEIINIAYVNSWQKAKMPTSNNRLVEASICESNPYIATFSKTRSAEMIRDYLKPAGIKKDNVWHNRESILKCGCKKY